MTETILFFFDFRTFHIGVVPSLLHGCCRDFGRAVLFVSSCRLLIHSYTICPSIFLSIGLRFCLPWDSVYARGNLLSICRAFWDGRLGFASLRSRLRTLHSAPTPAIQPAGFPYCVILCHASFSLCLQSLDSVNCEDPAVVFRNGFCDCLFLTFTLKSSGSKTRRLIDLQRF